MKRAISGPSAVFLVLVLVLVLVLASGGAPVHGEAPGAGASEEFFELRVRPLLADHCVKCHGPKKASGGLRVDSREALLTGGDGGPAVVPGEPQGGMLLLAIRHVDEDLKMPPSGPLPKSAQDDLAAWIAAGAPWPKAAASARPIEGRGHWAFEPLRTVAAPDDPTGWAASPIDRLIAEQQRAHGVHPVDPADRRALIRRATFDLIGLPPRPDRVEAFAADDRPDAFERLVDELLASPQYGERWGRYWLDLARYADTAGDNSDYPIPEARLYRDYVIDAFNADLPYDRFLHEQLAGDVMAADGPAEDYARQVTATGFLAQAKRFGTRKLEDPHQIIEDVLNTTGQTALGLSLRCARCHDHKYDPISARDYYALYGFFAGARFPFAGAEEDHRPSEFAPLAPPDAMHEYEGRHARAVAELEARIKEAEAPEPKPTAGRRQAGLKGLKDELKRLREEGPAATAPRAYAVREGKATDVKLQIGGDPHKLGELVPRGVPRVFEPSGVIALPPTGSGRLALARWLTEGSPRALAARVMVNRIWAGHFGKAIVATPSDFGLRGAPPSHPDLLERLAADFIASGWSIKAMHRRIMLTATYRLASAGDSQNAEADTGNAWYWRFDRRPLDAEALRDSLLALGGGLQVDRPGAHPFPAEESWRFTAHHQFHAVYPSSHRSVYLMVQRLHPHPYLSLFNGPDASATTATRDHAPMALQSLYLVNNPFVHDQARRFAERLLVEASDDPGRLGRAYLEAYGRPPSAAERDRAGAFLRAYEGGLAAEGAPEGRRQAEAWAALARALLASNEFLYID